MGQRHYTFIKIKNPLIAEDSESFRKNNPERYAVHKKIFGTNKYSVLAIYHSWLFGFSALFPSVKLLRLANWKEKLGKFNREYNPLSPNWERGEFTYNFNFANGENSQLYRGELIVDFIMSALKIMDVKEINVRRGGGIQSGCFHLINVEDEGIEKDFRNGDIDDGITIIDLVEKKYCLLEPFGHSGCTNDSGDLPKLVPISAKEYVRAYYPTDKRKFKGMHKDSDKKDKLVKEHKELVAKAEKLMKKWDVLTLTDVKKIFPAVYKEVTPKENEELKSEIAKLKSLAK